MYTKNQKKVLVKTRNQEEEARQAIVSRSCKICINSTLILSCTLGRQKKKTNDSRKRGLCKELYNARSIFYTENYAVKSNDIFFFLRLQRFRGMKRYGGKKTRTWNNITDTSKKCME